MRSLALPLNEQRLGKYEIGPGMGIFPCARDRVRIHKQWLGIRRSQDVDKDLMEDTVVYFTTVNTLFVFNRTMYNPQRFLMGKDGDANEVSREVANIPTRLQMSGVMVNQFSILENGVMLLGPLIEYR